MWYMPQEIGCSAVSFLGVVACLRMAGLALYGLAIDDMYSDGLPAVLQTRDCSSLPVRLWH